MKDINLKNDLLKKELLKLSTDLSIEKNNNLKLSQRIRELEKIVNIKGDQYLTENSNININKLNDYLISELNNKLKNLNNSLNNNLTKDKMNELLDEIRIKDKIISNYPVKLSDGEKLISIIFVSADQKVHYSVMCKNTDIFNTIENILYKEHPEFMKPNNDFYVEGNKINKYKSLEFNKIKNNDIITLKNI